jgi:hypothetical protein
MPIDSNCRVCTDQIFGPCAAHAWPPPLPPTVTARLQHAFGVLHAWNAAVTQARRMEAVARQPGRYEYDLRYTDLGALHRHQLAAAQATLAQLEQAAWDHGITPEQLYAPLGGKPVLLPEAAAVQAWR